MDALNHLEASNSVLVLGSTEPHYTPSKAFQAILSGRPVFAMLHAESTAVDMIRAARGTAMTLTGTELPKAVAIAAELSALVRGKSDAGSSTNRTGFDAYTAREATRAFAEALDRACARRAGQS